ncbi:hypothetical protein H8D36_01215 [archaeon]|nr:hypothetical protein [archaeon]
MARMKVINKLGTRAIKKEGGGSFLLTNKTGSFLSLGSKRNISHTQGLFHLNKNWDMYKSLENIYLDKEITELENSFDHVCRRYDNTSERFFLSSTALIYEVKNYSGHINLELDFREMFNFNDEERVYTVENKNDLIIIHYKKHKKYFVIKGANNYERIGQWEHRDYSYDKARNTKSDFYIYKALRIWCDKDIKLFISFSETKKEAIQQVESACQNIDIIKDSLRIRRKNTCRKKNLAENTALYALDSLKTIVGKGDHKLEGVMAGLPWFHQFWSRDELISLKAFMIQGNFDFVKKRLICYLNAINDNGRIPNRLPHADLSSADAIGWLFKRLYDLLITLEKHKCLESYFSQEELADIKHKLHFCIEEQMVQFMKDYIMYSGEKETWMDTTIQGQDGRTGACIEIQALFLSCFKLMKVLCKNLKITYYGYGSLEKMFVKKIRAEFFKDGFLYDRLGDKTIRPNVFITYYAYPELLKKHEWKIVFNKAIRGLWLDWGALSSIDVKSEFFQEYHTGHNNLSYHNGDSWFWINNLAATCMQHLDAKKYKYHIERLYKSSEEEMYSSGFIGHCAEISSAKEMRSEGCMTQAWSAATFIELCEQLKKKS